jgi:hypothetical protein
MSRPVFMVGSAPFKPEEAMERFGTTLAGLAKRLPDGEQYGWLPLKVIESSRGIVGGNDEPIQATGPTAVRQTLRVADGVDPEEIEFETLHYARAARDSYAIFTRLRDEGKIEPGTRFQISIPSPFTACLIFDADVLRAIWPVYERRLLANVVEMLASIPHEDLAISWDVVAEFMLLTAPSSRDSYELDEMAAAIARLIDAIPEDVQTGLHFCYGRHNSRGEVEFASKEERDMLAPTLREVSDTELMVRFFNEIHRHAHRPINWVHIPVPRKHDDLEFYAPLGGLELDGITELYLGLLHLEDGVEGARRKLAAAETAGVPFGVAAPCGFRASTSNMPDSIRGLNHDRSVAIVEFHREVAELAE